MTHENWPKYTLSEVCDLINGNGFKASEWDTTGLPIIRIQNLNGSREFNYYSGDVQPRWLVEPGDLLFAWAGVKGVSFGPRIWNGPRGVLNQHIFRVVPKNGVTKEYLYAVMGLVTSRIEAKSHGFKANFVHVQRGDILDQNVAVPPLPLQEKITAILSTWERAIEVTEKLIAAKQRRKAALMQHLLNGKVRLAGFTGEWQTTHLGDLGPFSKGAGISKSEVIADGHLAVRYGELYTTHHTVIRSIQSRISDQSAAESRRIATGDILFPCSGETADEIGKPAVYLGTETAYAGGDIIVFTPQQGDPLFLAYLLNAPDAFRYRASHAKGHSVVHIYAASLKGYEFSLPSIAEQKAIAAVLDTQDREIGLLHRKLDALRRQGKGLMQHLLTGKLLVEVLAEPLGD